MTKVVVLLLVAALVAFTASWESGLDRDGDLRYCDPTLLLNHYHRCNPSTADYRSPCYGPCRSPCYRPCRGPCYDPCRNALYNTYRKPIYSPNPYCSFIRHPCTRPSYILVDPSSRIPCCKPCCIPCSCESPIKQIHTQLCNECCTRCTQDCPAQRTCGYKCCLALFCPTCSMCPSLCVYNCSCTCNCTKVPCNVIPSYPFYPRIHHTSYCRPTCQPIFVKLCQ